MSKSFIQDSSGTHSLEDVVSITPVSDPAPANIAPRVRAVLHMRGGQYFNTQTDYAVALKAWGYTAPAPAAG